MLDECGQMRSGLLFMADKKVQKKSLENSRLVSIVGEWFYFFLVDRRFFGFFFSINFVNAFLPKVVSSTSSMVLA